MQRLARFNVANMVRSLLPLVVLSLVIVGWTALRQGPDVLVVSKADLGDVARRARRDLHAALRSLGDRETEVVATSSPL